VARFQVFEVQYVIDQPNQSVCISDGNVEQAMSRFSQPTDLAIDEQPKCSATR
jgi:hypothetical protein